MSISTPFFSYPQLFFQLKFFCRCRILTQPNQNKFVYLGNGKPDVKRVAPGHNQCYLNHKTFSLSADGDGE